MNQLAGQGWLGEYKWSTNEKEQFRDHALQTIASIVAKHGGTVRVVGKTLDIDVPDENKVQCAMDIQDAMAAMGCPV